jgi:hypothetical protein
MEFARRTEAAGVEVGLDRLAEMPHNGPILAECSQEGRRGVALGAAFLAQLSSVGACAQATQR